ncbi:MAG: hypothetical protein LBD24_03280 [Spirochaetaceae bacterium]|nr:hypothetical protein [Spirochaetaceae bacterium]
MRATTHGFRTAIGCAKRSRASTATSEVTGQGVAPFKKQQCLKQPEAGRPCCASAAGGIRYTDRSVYWRDYDTRH